MINVEKLLARKSGDLFTIGADASAATALSMLAEHKIGALLVMDGDHLAGILSERDCAIKVALPGLSATDVTVADIMTTTVITVEPQQELDTCMQLMTERDIRHLPVKRDELVVGMVSIGDVVKELLREQQAQISDLETYIKGHGSRPMRASKARSAPED